MKQLIALMTLATLPVFAETLVLDLGKNAELAKIEVNGPYYTGCGGRQLDVAFTGRIEQKMGIEILNPRKVFFDGFMKTLEKKLAPSTFAQVQDAFRPVQFPGGMITCQAMVRDSGETFVDLKQLLANVGPNVKIDSKLSVELADGLSAEVVYFNQQN